MSLNPPIRQWHDRVVWIIGASSGIGRATAARLHALGAVTVVSARNAGALDAFVREHPGSHAMPLDVADRARMAEVLKRVLALRGRLDLVMYCAGHYRAMRAANFDLDQMQRHLQINYIGALHMLDIVLPLLQAQRHGHLSLVASAAGYRGLPQAMAYGPTKAALQHLGETLYLDLHPMGVGVSVVNPGFVATPLTAGNRFEMPALLSVDQAACHIVRGWTRGRFDIHFPARFTTWLKLMRHLPHRWYFAVIRRVVRA